MNRLPGKDGSVPTPQDYINKLHEDLKAVGTLRARVCGVLSAAVRSLASGRRTAPTVNPTLIRRGDERC